MKKLFLILFIFIVSCVSTQKMQEGIFYKTRIYVGKYTESHQVNKKYTYVMTTMGLFKLKHNPDIPDSALCYVRLEYPTWEMHPDLYRQMTAKYFTWNGSDKEYMVYNDINKIQ